MLIRLQASSAATLIGCLFAVTAYAQERSASPEATAPANVAYVEGVVEVVQDGVSERANPPLMLLDGDLVRTGNGRAEIVFADGTLLHLSNDTDLELLGAERLRLITGRASVRLSHAAARPYVIDTPASSVRLESEGEYGLIVDRTSRLEVTVARGTATIDDGVAPSTISGGLRLTLAGPGARPLIESYNSARWDAFARWTHDRVTGFSTSHSASRLPYELRPYASVLDHHGRWDYVAPHGYVWFPSVGASWRPYYDGFWSFTSFGWTWRGHDQFAWPTHHYGRWGFNGSFWYWIPAGGWAPAWVSWSVAPGYVSWSPLGWDGRPAIGLRGRRDHPAYWPHYDPWRSWTVVPRQHFGPRLNPRKHAIAGDRLDDATRRTLAVDHAVPVSAAGDVAVPRDVFRSDRRGDVRRPGTTGATGAAGAAGARGAAGAVGARRRAPGAKVDAPEFAPPASWNAPAERRGNVRARDRATVAGSTPDRTPRAKPPAGAPAAPRPGRRLPSTQRSEPSKGSPPSSSRPQRAEPRGGGARNRGTVARPPAARSTGEASRPKASPPPSPSTQGGARRRPPPV